MRAAAWPGMSAVIDASSRSSIWNITWMCCIASQAHWPARRPLEQKRQAGLWPAELRSDLGSVDANGTASKAEPGR